MKRLLCILLLLLLLAGCSKEMPESTATHTISTTTTVPETSVPETSVPETKPTEPELNWIEEKGQPWDAEGSLIELPVTVPNSLIYTSFIAFDGDLLLWSQDNHRADRPRTQLCLVDLDTGEVLAQADISIFITTVPQPLGDKLYLFDSNSGLILQLDKQLQVVDQWQPEIRHATAYMGADDTVYVHTRNEGIYALDLNTGEQRPVLVEDPEIYYMLVDGDYLRVIYYHPDTGEQCNAFVDLRTGERHDLPLRGASGCEYSNGTWLSYELRDSFVYTLTSANGEAVSADTGYRTIRLLEDNVLLMINEEGNQLSLHDLTGKGLAKCIISEQGYAYVSYELIPSDTFGGYFVIISNTDGVIRLFHWDPSKNQPGGDIPFEPVLRPTEIEANVLSRVEELERTYGLNILVGQEIDESYFDFVADKVTDWNEIQDALDVLEDVLEDYPEGFFRQLRYGEIQRTEIHLAGTLTASNAEYTDVYEAFVQEDYECHMMVVDIFLADESTYYHEFSHIIDSFLVWDAMQREDALFNDEAWCSLNPAWFPGYTYSYSWEQHVQDYSCFIDSYSTINPTEDRARVLEHAMVTYGDSFFENGTVLTQKLDYYCQCIRDAFDTTNWPDTVLWEQYLP